MKTFRLIRFEDETGISGTGLVAEGVQFTGGKCVLCWLRPPYGLNIYDSLGAVEIVHGHGGKTRLVWVDSDDYVTGPE